MNVKLCVLPGDGIGPEIVFSALDVLYAVGARYNMDFTVTEAPFGGASIDEHGVPLTEGTLALAKTADAVLLGSVGGPKWDALPRTKRPESGLLALRKALGLYMNLRPVKDMKALRHQVALKPEVVAGTDLIFCRELTGGIYFGEKGRDEAGAYDMMRYSRADIERIVRRAFDIAQRRPRKRLTSVDKANVLETSRLWREVVDEAARDYPEVAVDHMYVDNAALQLIINPRHFDVVVTENSFGDILSDESAALSGSLGMMPSASLGGVTDLYEPAHGSAPDIAGQDKANPAATILSVALMLRHTFHNEEAAQMVERAIEHVITVGIRTADLAEIDGPIVGTKSFAQAVIAAFDEVASH